MYIFKKDSIKKKRGNFLIYIYIVEFMAKVGEASI